MLKDRVDRIWNQVESTYIQKLQDTNRKHIFSDSHIINIKDTAIQYFRLSL